MKTRLFSLGTSVLAVATFALAGCGNKTTAAEPVGQSATAAAQVTASNPTVSASKRPFWRLKEGSCVNLDGVEGSTIDELPYVGCDQPHDAEIYAYFALKNADAPSDVEMRRQAGERCTAELVEYLIGATSRVELKSFYYFRHLGVNGVTLDRGVVCLAVQQSGSPLSASIRG